MKTIQSISEELLELSEKALEWIENYGEEINIPALLKTTKGIRRSLKRVNKASQKRTATAIFGQSQVGKSYLVQNLSRPENSTYLQIHVNQAETLDFITDINPAGGQESTGTVTRFSTRRGEQDSDYPIRVELLTQLDVASIIVNGYLSDLKDFPQNETISQDHIHDLIESSKEVEYKPSDLHEDDTHEFIQYIKDKFSDNATVRELNKISYFSLLVSELHNINPNERWRLLELLWEKNSFLTNLFRRLTDALDSVSFEKNIRVQVEAITPNTTTILDVQRVREIFDQGVDQLTVKGQSFEGIKISRALFSALIREVELTIENDFSEDRNRSFMQDGDLLDFPGSKSREKIPVEVYNANDSDQKLHLFIRGKVSYLFDSYTTEFGVSSLLYCMDNHPPEEKEAPARLSRWISKYVGHGAEQRRHRISEIEQLLEAEGVKHDKVSPLLVVLTKFNVEMGNVLFGQDMNEEKYDPQWQARIEENFANFMNRPVEDKWASNWTKEEAEFPFVFPIRDPLYSQATFEGMDAHGREIQLRPERVSAVLAMGRSFNNSPVVQKHILNPEKIWNELTTANGSGIQYLCSYLGKSAHPLLLESRLRKELVRAKSDLLSTLSPFVVSGDLDTDLKEAKRKKAATKIALAALSVHKDMPLPKILGRLSLEPTEMWNLLYDFKYKYGKQEEDETASKIELDQISEGLISMGLKEETLQNADNIEEALLELFPDLTFEEILDTIADQFEIDLKQFIQQLRKADSSENDQAFSSIALSYWGQKIVSFFENEASMDALKPKQREALLSSISEILKAQKTFSLQEKLEMIGSELYTGVLELPDYDMVASSYCDILNSFLFTAGWKFQDEVNRPNLLNREARIFSSQELPNTIEFDYDASHNVRGNRFIDHWTQGIAELYETNVKFEYGANQEINEAANAAMSELMKHLYETNVEG